jgi:hypothetical protein
MTAGANHHRPIVFVRFPAENALFQGGEKATVM